MFNIEDGDRRLFQNVCTSPPDCISDYSNFIFTAIDNSKSHTICTMLYKIIAKI
jgi:hypothetical protein